MNAMFTQIYETIMNPIHWFTTEATAGQVAVIVLGGFALWRFAEVSTPWLEKKNAQLKAWRAARTVK